MSEVILEGHIGLGLKHGSFNIHLYMKGTLSMSAVFKEDVNYAAILGSHSVRSFG